MRMKHKLLIVIILTLLTIILLSNITIATTLTDLDEPSSGEFDKVGNAVVKTLTTIGMVTSVIALVIIGIKYMMGSLEERATYKKTMFPYVIGAILVFSASTIASVVYNIAKDL